MCVHGFGCVYVGGKIGWKENGKRTITMVLARFFFVIKHSIWSHKHGFEIKNECNINTHTHTQSNRIEEMSLFQYFLYLSIKKFTTFSINFWLNMNLKQFNGMGQKKIKINPHFSQLKLMKQSIQSLFLFEICASAFFSLFFLFGGIHV